MFYLLCFLSLDPVSILISNKLQSDGVTTQLSVLSDTCPSILVSRMSRGVIILSSNAKQTSSSLDNTLTEFIGADLSAYDNEKRAETLKMCVLRYYERYMSIQSHE